LESRIQVLDLGVCFDEKLSFKEHFHAKINKAYMMLGLIKRNFKYLFQLLFSYTSAWLGIILIIAPLFGHHIEKEI